MLTVMASRVVLHRMQREVSYYMKLFLTSEYASNISGRKNNRLRNQPQGKKIRSMFYMFSNINFILNTYIIICIRRSMGNV